MKIGRFLQEDEFFQPQKNTYANHKGTPIPATKMLFFSQFYHII